MKTSQIVFAGIFSLKTWHTKPEDIVVGLPAAGQSMVGKDLLVGHCVNLLPLRSRPEGCRKFSEYVKAFRSVMLDGYEHQQVTFGSLLKRMKLQRDPTRIPLVSVIFNIDMGIDLQGMKFADLEVDFYANPRLYENFELFLNISPAKGGRFVFEFTYNTNLFASETIERWAEEFNTMLHGIVADPEQTLGELPLLPPWEIEQVLSVWNDTYLDYPLDECVHELFESQAVNNPESIAVSDVSASLTYQELNRQSEQLARHLADLGVTQNTLVGIYLERSIDMVVAVLAVMKSGAAYVPLDPAFPQERLQIMIKDSGCQVIISQRSLAGHLSLESVELAIIDEIETWTVSSTLHSRRRGYSSDDPAYVIYTSGSTGQPKGVAIPHKPPACIASRLRPPPCILLTMELIGS